MNKPNRPKDKGAGKRGGQPAPFPNPVAEFFANKGVRETIESVAIAFVLAFLFRTFEAEAFVIPTGSMAPTLMGQHKDIVCPQCGFAYQAGASEDAAKRSGPVIGAVCPMCRFELDFGANERDYPSYTGDRILVSKFIYDFSEPKRWDVIVFKYPGNAKQNYIKRLVGLPEETVRIRHGNIFVKHDGESDFQITRRPPYKLAAMLQHVYDTHHIPKALVDAGFPDRWQIEPAAQGPGWTSQDEIDGQVIRRSFAIQNPSADQDRWVRYHQIVPAPEDWDRVLQGQRVTSAGGMPAVVTDFYGYNTSRHLHADRDPSALHWVGDLALECEVRVLDAQGELALDLVEAGRHHQCRINLADGLATLSIVDADGQPYPFVDAQDRDTDAVPTAKTAVRGPGNYRLRWANADDQLVLWVNGSPVEFDRPANYRSPHDDRPVWTPEDPGDSAPAAVGSRGASLAVSRLRVYRDIYYIASGTTQSLSDYGHYSGTDEIGRRYETYFYARQIHEILADPRIWDKTPLFAARQEVDYHLEKDQFFPLGDNSPQSKDARLWGNEHYVQRPYLTGKALLIYWPHAKNFPLPFTPNFERMGFVR